MLLDVSINQAFNMGGPQLLAFILLTSILVSYGKKLDMEHDAMRTAEDPEDGTAPLTTFIGDMPVITIKDKPTPSTPSGVMLSLLRRLCRRRCIGRTSCQRTCLRIYSWQS